MDLETCRYIDLPGVGVIDLEVPQLPEKEYNAAAAGVRARRSRIGLEGAAGVRARRRLCPSRCRRHRGCGPRSARGTRGADRRRDRAAACR
jgi:hypothetical protein